MLFNYTETPSPTDLATAAGNLAETGADLTTIVVVGIVLAVAAVVLLGLAHARDKFNDGLK